MAALVVAEHDNRTVRGATLNTVAAALKCSADVHVLIAGADAADAAKAAGQIAGVAKVLHADATYFEHGLAENIAAQVLAIAKDYRRAGKADPESIQLLQPALGSLTPYVRFRPSGSTMSTAATGREYQFGAIGKLQRRFVPASQASLVCR